MSAPVWTVEVYGGDCPGLIRYRLDDEPTERDLDDLLVKHHATLTAITPPTPGAAA